MTTARYPMYWDPILEDFVQFDPENDALQVVIGTTVTSGEAFSRGDFLYLKNSDRKWWKAKADSDSTYQAKVLALEDAAGADLEIQCALPSNDVPGLTLETVELGAAYSLASPALFTSVGHGFSVNDYVILKNPTGDIAAGNYRINTAPSVDTFTIKTLAGVAVNSAAGGTADVYRGFEPGKKYFLSAATAGAAMRPASDLAHPEHVVELGEASSPSSLLFEPVHRVKL